MTQETNDVVGPSDHDKLLEQSLFYKRQWHQESARAERLQNELQSQSARIAELLAVEADAVSGLRYIVARYGRLEGVGWDRVFDAHEALTKDSTSGG